MKKYLALVLGMLFILCFTASAFAVHSEIPSETQAMVAKGTTQVTMGGELRVRGWYLKNYSADRRSGAGTPADSNGQGWYDQRVRLSLAIETSKNTSGFIHLESAPNETFTSDVTTWGTANTKPSGDLTFLEAWILYKGTGLGIPAGLKVGHMPLALGEKEFLDHTKFGSDAIVFFMDPTKQLHIGLITAKLSEGSVAAQTSGTTNDINSYHALATYKVGGGTFGVNYTYIDDQTGTYTGTKNTFASLQNIGVHASGKAGIVSYKAFFDKQFGDAPDGADPDGSNVNSSDRYKGYAYLLGLGVTPAPVVTIRGEYAFGSGDNVTNDGDNEAFQTTLGNDIHYTQIYEYTTRGAARTSRQTGLANTTYYRAGIDINPTKDLSASLDYFVLRANKTLGAGTVTESAPNSKRIGTETDLKISYKLDKNLTYFIMAGYLDTGGWWTTNTTTTVANDKPITQAVHGLTLSF
ncbi:MAG: alginate export family protein [Thermodesulfovibrionales bacterium]|nr:alginate export family protein [Thermodesulfovibrionales bacterium]